MPEIETSRLYLRLFKPEDLVAHRAAVDDDPAVTWSGQRLSLEESQQRWANRLEHWRQHGFGMWVVIDKDSNTLMGHCGLQFLNDTEEVEVGYYLAKTAWEKGFATEAAKASLWFGFEQLALNRIVAVTRLHNTASMHVLEKLGMRYERHAHVYGADVKYYALNRSDYQPTSFPYRLI